MWNHWSSGKDNINCGNCNIVIAYVMLPEVYSEPYEISKMVWFARIISGKKPFTIFAKLSILDAWYGSKYTSGHRNPFLSPIFKSRAP